MNRWTALLLLVSAAPSAEIRYLQYERPVESASQNAKQTCVALDSDLYAKAAPGLADVRLYRGRSETPYLVATSAPAPEAAEQSIGLMNLGVRAGQTVFDAAMPPGGSYSDLELAVTGQDFISTVTVTGNQGQTGPGTRIGAYTIFDLTRQRLGRSTVLHLPPSNFRYLHFAVSRPLQPESIGGLTVERAAVADPKYTTVAESRRGVVKGQTTVIELMLPARVPVERIEFVPGPSPANFSRDVTVTATAIIAARTSESAETPPAVTSSGSLLRVHTVRDGHAIDQERLTMEAPRVTFDYPSKWTITIDNGDDAPLMPAAVRLQMVERNLCFEGAGGGAKLYYGDAALAAPRYDLAQLSPVHMEDAAHATAGPEQANPEYRPRPDERPFTEKHPALLWIALAAVVALLGGIMLRTARPPRAPVIEKD